MRHGVPALADDASSRMDAIYRTQRHIYDASRKYFLLGRDRLLSGLVPPPGGTILEVGCGTGRNLIVAARRYRSARVYGFDISRAMLETAGHAIAHSGCRDRIQTVQGDAACFSPRELFGVEGFDRVFVSYALSMIPPWRQAVQAAFDAVAPGGSLHIVDFGEQERWPLMFRKALRAWLRKFSVEPRAGLEAELETMACASGARLEFTSLYRDYARLAVLERP